MIADAIVAAAGDRIESIEVLDDDPPTPGSQYAGRSELAQRPVYEAAADPEHLAKLLLGDDDLVSADPVMSGDKPAREALGDSMRGVAGG